MPLEASDIRDLMYPPSGYSVTIEFSYLESQIERNLRYGLDLNPEFQRQHVWTEAQRVAYLEHILTGGETGKDILLGDTGEPGIDGKSPNFVIIDGRNRLAAIRAFVAGEIRVFAGRGGRAEGWKWDELGISLRRSHIASVRWSIVRASSLSNLVALYLKFNEGGTPHAAADLDRARAIRERLAREGK